MKLLICGASGHARVVIDAIEQAGDHEIIGLVAEGPRNSSVFCGYPILGAVSDLASLSEQYQVEGLLVGIGDNWNRAEVARVVGDILPSSQFINSVHPSAQIARCVEIGSGTVVMAGAVVNSGSRIGRHCIINTRASVDHDCAIGDFVSIAPGATLGGNVQVGDFTAVCLGASVIHGLAIGEHTVVGAGSVVVRNLDSYVVAYGAPARVIRNRDKAQRYL